MKTILGICLLLLAANQACASYEAVENAFSRASNDATGAIIGAVISSSERAAELYEVALAIFQQQATIAVRSGKITAEQATDLLEEIDTEFENAEAAQATVAADALEAIATAQREVVEAMEDATIGHALVKREVMLYEDFPITKEQIQEALAKAHAKVKEIVKVAVEKVNSGLARVEGFLERMMKKVADSKVFQDMKQRIQEMIKKVSDQISGDAEKKIQPTFDVAVTDADNAIFGLQLDDMRAKRAINDVWTKITEAIKKIGGTVYETAKQVLEEQKPEIMEALNKLGKILISVGKQIAIELAGEIVKASLA